MTDDTQAASSGSKSEKWIYWHGEVEQARKIKGFDQWRNRALKIVKRYRDERGDPADYQDSANVETAKFNILWSNVQTLLPALIGKTPKPIVQRRYLDSDEVGRVATVILERALSYELDDGIYFSAVRKAVLDRLLPGRGVAWVRYEPRFAPITSKTQETAAPEGEETDEPDEDENETEGADDEPDTTSGGEPDEEVASESVPVDYTDWQDFMTSPGRIWEEVWWIGKRVYLTRDELVRKFGDKGRTVPLDFSPAEADKVQPGINAGTSEQQRRAKVWEIWNKRDRKVIWFSEAYSDDILDEKPDPLRLEGFWPCPRPLFASLTNESLIPIPDYYEYQDQATELDDLTARIKAVTQAIKVAGVYDASVPELQRMFEEGFENRLVPCDNMAEFTTKAGQNGIGHLWLLPIKDMAAVLSELFMAREQVKQSLYEITGISDIVRGAASEGGAKTATEQRIKGQFASMRLNDMQAEVTRFCRDTLNIMGEIIAEHFDPMTLFLISGYEQWAKDQWWDDFKPAPVPPPPMMGHNGGPPLEPPGAPPSAPVTGAPGQPAQGMAAGGLPVDPAALAAQQQAMAQAAFQAKAKSMFEQAVTLLKNEKLRGFRIEIETDSMIEADRQATQQARTEFLAAVGQFLTQAVPLGQAMPEFMPLLGKALLFGVRGFSASRDLESAFEEMIDKLQTAAKNPAPKPPSPEQVKANAELQKQQMEGERQRQQAALDQRSAEQEFAMKQREADLDMRQREMELRFKQRELEMKQQELNMKLAASQREAAIKAQATERDAAFDQQAAERDAAMADRAAQRDEAAAIAQSERDAEAGEQQFQLQKKTAALKAQQAAKPKERAA